MTNVDSSSDPNSELCSEKNEVVVSFKNVEKKFSNKIALDKIGFSIYKGQTVGLIGPNGAGKTTAIRTLLGIYLPDSGEITLFGNKINEKTKSRIGYLPEERGLYLNSGVLEMICYFASLHGIKENDAKEEGMRLLKQIGLEAYAEKKVNTLSKGMQQKIQFICAIVHKPSLVIFDEPFSGLDPLNSEMLKNMMLDLTQKGVTVILCTHMMEQAEKMCDRIIMINRGKIVLEGTLSEIKNRFGKDSVRIEFIGKFPAKLGGVKEINNHGNYVEIKLESNTDPNSILKELISKKIEISKFEIEQPSLHQIFLEVAK